MVHVLVALGVVFVATLVLVLDPTHEVFLVERGDDLVIVRRPQHGDRIHDSWRTR